MNSSNTLGTAMILMSLGALGLAIPATATAESPSQSSAVVGQLDVDYVRDVHQSARRVSLGYDQGMLGEGQFTQGLKLQIPFGQFAGMRLRPMWMHARTNDAYDAAMGGRIDFYGSSPILLGVVRLYGGGGPQIGYRPFYDTSDPGDQTALGLGGFFGWEFFVSRNYTFSLEVGGQSPLHGAGLGAGASVMAGMNFFF